MDKADIKQKLLAEIAKTEERIAEYEEMTQPVAPDVSIGRLSRLDAINNKSVVEAALRQARDKLSGLHFAMNKIDSADFGVCMKCKGAIPPGRILIRPESVYCVNCAR